MLSSMMFFPLLPLWPPPLPPSPVWPVLCPMCPRGGHLFQHLLLPEAALLSGPGPQCRSGCPAGGWGPHRGRGQHATRHCHQDTL